MKATGLDIGTTTISAVVLDMETGKAEASRTIPNDSFLQTEHEWERMQDAAVILEKAKAVLDELLKEYPDTASIGLTGQMHGIVYTDPEGRCISPLYTWQDTRGNLPGKDGLSTGDRVWKACGVSVSAGYGLLTHLYNMEHGLVPQKSVSICTIADYLGMRLTGRNRPLVHISNAASMGFFDSREGCFQKTILQKMGMDTSMLPEVSEEFSVLGTYRGIPVTIAIGDNQAGFLGTVGCQERTVLLNMGTGGQISLLSEQYFEAPGIEARPFMKGKYLLAGSSLCGGRAYAVLERFFRRYLEAAGAETAPQYEIMERLARKGMEGQNRMKVCTAWKGTRAEPDLTGSITGLTEDNFTPEGLVYGVLEGMAAELYELYEVIQKGTGIQVQRLTASGNGIRKNPVLQKILSQMFGAEIKLAAYEEEAACGAAVSSFFKSSELS